MKKNKAFTLIELIAVLVILAILALIVTPLVMNIIKKSRISADKRSIDAYGRSIELGIAKYLLDEGRFPTSISDLTIEYSGDEVVCSTTDLNSDSTIYLTGCTVAGRIVDYEYRTLRRASAKANIAYSVGDEVTYNDVDYYVIKASDENDAIVTLLKAEPLTYEELLDYKPTSAQTNTNNGYAGIQYGSSNTYEDSYVKVVVDGWKEAKAPSALTARLLCYDDFEELGYELGNVISTGVYWVITEAVPTFVYNSSYRYWTMDAIEGTNFVWSVTNNGTDNSYIGVNSNMGPVNGAVRPVIVLPKSLL